MQADKMIKKEDPRWEKPEGLETQFGECKFCGQIARIEALFPWTEAECNECATELCNCNEARMYTNKKTQKEKGAEQIEAKFGEKALVLGNHERVLETLNACMVNVVDEVFSKVSIRINEHIKADISINSKGKVKVSRTVTDTETAEV